MSALETSPESRFTACDSHFSLYKMTGDEEHLHAMFRLLDLDDDRRVSKAEITQYYSNSESENRAKLITKAVFALADTNGDGTLDESEFVCWCKQFATFEFSEIDTSQRATATEVAELERILTRYQATHDPKHLEAMFHLIDLNHDGCVSRSELRSSVLCQCFQSPDFASSFLMELGDTNDDGVLNAKEFVELMVGCFAGLIS